MQGTLTIIIKFVVVSIKLFIINISTSWNKFPENTNTNSLLQNSITLLNTALTLYDALANITFLPLYSNTLICVKTPQNTLKIVVVMCLNVKYVTCND